MLSVIKMKQLIVLSKLFPTSTFSVILQTVLPVAKFIIIWVEVIEII